MRSLPVLLSIAALIVACTKSETTDTKPMTSSSATPAASSAPAMSASAATSASAAPTTSTTAAGTTTNATDSGATAATPGGTDGGKAGDAGAASANASGAGECGTKPLPDCPLQAWMKSNMNPPVMTSDTAKLADALEKAAGFGPPGYTNWASIAKDGAKAAKGGDMAAAKASCRSCHDQYKKKYQTEFRTKKI